jgi:hypothetical protein
MDRDTIWVIYGKEILKRTLERYGVREETNLTLNLLTSTIVHLLAMLANGRWDLIRRLEG